MSEKINTKIDLNNLENWNLLNLTENQINNFRVFLEKKHSKEKLWIIELTTEELQKVKSLLEKDKKYEEFIFLEQQLSEITKTSELMAWTKIEKLLTEVNIDNFSYDLLFGKNWKLNKLKWISEITKRNLSTGFSLFMLEKINEILESKKGKWILASIKDIINTSNLKKLLKWEWWSYFKDILWNDIWIKVKSWFKKIDTINFDSIKLNENEIKNPIIWKKIFDTAKTEEIEINNENISNKQKVYIKELWEKLWKNIPVIWLFEQFWEQRDTFWKWIEKAMWSVSPNLINSIKNYSENPWAFAKFIRFILNIFNINLNNTLNNSYVKSIKQIFTEKITNEEYKNLIFQKENLSNDFFKNIDKNKLWILDKLKAIAKLKWKKIYKKDFILWLLNKEWPLKNKNIVKNWNINYKELVKSIDEYKKTFKTKQKVESNQNISSNMQKKKASKDKKSQKLNTLNDNWKKFEWNINWTNIKIEIENNIINYSFNWKKYKTKVPFIYRNWWIEIKKEHENYKLRIWWKRINLKDIIEIKNSHILIKDIIPWFNIKMEEVE